MKAIIKYSNDDVIFCSPMLKISDEKLSSNYYVLHVQTESQWASSLVLICKSTEKNEQMGKTK